MSYKEHICRSFDPHAIGYSEQEANVNIALAVILGMIFPHPLDSL